MILSKASLKSMATHSSVLAWRIPGTAEPGGLPSVGLHRVGHDWSDLAAAAAAAVLSQNSIPWTFKDMLKNLNANLHDWFHIQLLR